MENLSKLKELYEQDCSNDSVLLSILNKIVDQVSGALLTEKGQTYLFYSPNNDLLILNDTNTTKENVQQSIVRLSLYFTIVYVATTLFLGYMENSSKLEKEMFDFLQSLLPRCKELNTIVIESLNTILPYLNDEYAKIYHLEKIWFFEKDLYKSKNVPLVLQSKLPKNAAQA